MSDSLPTRDPRPVTYPDGSTLGVEVDGAFVHLVARDEDDDLIRDTTLTPNEAHDLGDALVDASSEARTPDVVDLDDDALLEQFVLDDERPGV